MMMSTTMLRTAFTTCAVKGARTKASMRNGATCASSSGSSSSSSMRLLSSASDGRGRRAQTRAAGEKVDAAPVVALPTSDESENLLKIRHTSAHVMAMAVQKVFPSAQCTIGPWIERGFYYDFYYPEGFTNQDMKNIQKEMYKIIRKDYPLRR